MAEPRPAERVGRVLADRYRLVRLVGRGGCGEVYEAEHIYIHKRVAVKLLRPHFASDPEAVQRLHREARATSAIGHPCIVQIEDFGTAEDGSVFLAMEWLEGVSLDQLVERGEVDTDRMFRLCLDICEGLAAAHQTGVVHRDLKPANVFVSDTSDGERAKLLDFGIAKLALDDSQLTRTGTFVGTPYYMAPEQASDDPVDPRADVYSLGVMLYELSTGTLPFTADSVLGVLHQHASRIPEPPSVRAPDAGISPAFDALVLTCMEKDPANRYQSAYALGLALASLRRADGPADAPADGPADALPTEPAPAPADFQPSSRKRLTIAAVLAIVVVGLVAGVVLWTNQEKIASAPGVAIDGGALTIRAAPPPATPLDAAPASPRDASPAPPTTDAAPAQHTAPPPADAWRHRGAGLGFSFEVTTPRTIAPGATFPLELRLTSLSPALEKSVAAGSLSARLFLSHYRRHNKKTVLEGRPDTNAALTLQARLAHAGKYHVRVELWIGKREVTAGRYDLCVGADPAGRAAHKVCPKMNPAKPSHKH